MNFVTFRQLVQKGKIRPAYFFLGEEDFLAENGAEILTNKLLTPDEKSMKSSKMTGTAESNIFLLIHISQEFQSPEKIGIMFLAVFSVNDRSRFFFF